MYKEPYMQNLISKRNFGLTKMVIYMYKEPYMQNLISKRNFGLTKWLYICIKNLICKI